MSGRVSPPPTVSPSSDYELDSSQEIVPFHLNITGTDNSSSLPVTKGRLCRRVVELVCACIAISMALEVSKSDAAWLYFEGLTGFVILWSFIMLCVEVFLFTTNNSRLRNRRTMVVFACGDWLASTFAIAACLVSLGLTIYNQFDFGYCHLDQHLCKLYWIASLTACASGVSGSQQFASVYWFLTKARMPPLGIPGSISSMLLRAGQLVFWGVSFRFLRISYEFSTVTTYYPLLVAIPIQMIWSTGAMCVDVLLWTHKINDLSPRSLKILAYGDYYIGLLVSGAMNWSSGVLAHVYYVRKCPRIFSPDTSASLLYSSQCTQFLISIVSACIGWLSIVVFNLVYLQLLRNLYV